MRDWTSDACIEFGAKTADHFTEPAWARLQIGSRRNQPVTPILVQEPFYEGEPDMLAWLGAVTAQKTRGADSDAQRKLARLRAENTNTTARRSSYPIVTKIRTDPAIPREHPTLSARPPLT